MTAAPDKLPVAANVGPHWRVLLRPRDFQPDRIASLADCERLIVQNKVRFRGWDYPHLGTRAGQVLYGPNWLGSWSDFWGHREYWRLYQSGQFLHLFSVREATEGDWDQKLRKMARNRLRDADGVNWDAVPGFIDIVNLLYQITEIYEFAGRLARAVDYGPDVRLQVEIHDVQGFVLMAGENRAWWNYFANGNPVLSRELVIPIAELAADQKKHVLDHVFWILHRFGWLNPPEKIFSKDYDEFVKGVV